MYAAHAPAQYSEYNIYEQNNYTRVVLADGSVALLPTREAIIGRDGITLYSSRETTLASPERLTEMRKELNAYNNGN